MTTPATSYAAMLDRIDEVLVDGRGVARVLAAADRYLRGVHPAIAVGALAVDATAKRRFLAYVEDEKPHDARVSELGASTLYSVTVRIESVHFGGHEELDAELRKSISDAEDDIHRMRAALGWPGNLSATEAAVPTGLVDGQLEWLRTQTRLATDARAVLKTTTFRADLHLSFPT